MKEDINAYISLEPKINHILHVTRDILIPVLDPHLFFENNDLWKCGPNSLNVYTYARKHNQRSLDLISLLIVDPQGERTETITTWWVISSFYVRKPQLEEILLMQTY